ncbi:hypothetical protein [Apilactobacillus apinorum]|uniref:Uncharacterized protein n=1 Tax=Apilactobacillus apinorum TaxID=1218495 RepID=A0ABP9ZGN0_9LACO
MKTLQDLVDRLNRSDQLNDNFSTSGSRDRDYSIDINGEEIILFSLKDRTYSFTSYIAWVNDKDQDLIVKYLANHTPDDWFAEKKYNIVIGQDKDKTNEYYTAYRKSFGNSFATNDATLQDELTRYEYLFTEQEIEELKSTLPTNMAKIVDLGKVEVKDD